MVFVTDAEGLVTHLGRQWTRLTGQTLAEARNFGWIRVLHPEDRDTVRGLVREAIETRSSFAVRFRLRSAEDDYLWVMSGAVPSFGPPGRTFLGFLGSLSPLDTPPEDVARASGSLRPPEPPWNQGSTLERAADYLLAAHSLIARSGRSETLDAVEGALRRLGEDLAEETMNEAAAQERRH
ncbi:PAS domain-containing protein [Methylobacterium sp. J-076]|uniref:PAS domain-containing protein n=1 Tax=Methylobacterium sp. J-076 TaxID=2836655 RepID=UPI001FB92C09|nr:PAS domain-containing protein [Methylobacterium sp. J-076]MCJ2014018.1 PAS domain-containing protein [Methylobacterium sp. J-076]